MQAYFRLAGRPTCLWHHYEIDKRNEDSFHFRVEIVIDLSPANPWDENTGPYKEQIIDGIPVLIDRSAGQPYQPTEGILGAIIRMLFGPDNSASLPRW